MLVKISVNPAARRDVLDIVKIFQARAVDVSDHTFTLEVKCFCWPNMHRFTSLKSENEACYLFQSVGFRLVSLGKSRMKVKITYS